MSARKRPERPLICILASALTSWSDTSMQPQDLALLDTLPATPYPASDDIFWARSLFGFRARTMDSKHV